MNVQSLVHNFWELTVTGFAQGAIYALFALGYTLVYGVLRLINFAHSEVFMIGTFGAILTWEWLGAGENSAIPGLFKVLFMLVAALIVAALASAAVALLVERLAYRPLRRRNAPPLAFLITAIGASVAISEAVGIRTHRQPSGTPDLIQQKTQFHLFDANVTNLQIGIILLALAMMVALDQFINRSRLGLGVRAVAQDPDTAALMGVNKDRVIGLIFVLGGLMAGIAAVMYVLKIGNTRYDAGFMLGIKAFAAAVLGGIGNLRGALLGGMLLGLVENYGSALFGTQWINAIAFIALVITLLFRPTGLLAESLGKARA